MVFLSCKKDWCCGNPFHVLKQLLQLPAGFLFDGSTLGPLREFLLKLLKVQSVIGGKKG